MIENDSVRVVHQVLCLKMELEPGSETLAFFKKIVDGHSTKKEDSVS